MVVWSAPLWSMTTAVPGSGCGWRVEAIHELDEHFLEAGLVVVGVVPDECDHLAVTVGSLTVLATGLIDHAEAIVAIVHVGEQQQEIGDRGRPACSASSSLPARTSSAAALDAMVSSSSSASSSASSAPERLAAMAAFTSRSCKR